MDVRFKRRMIRYLSSQEDAAFRRLGGLDINGSFDLWHTHIDWDNKANRVKSLVARSTYRALIRAESLTVNRSFPIQVWATLCECTGDNAVYLHTNNPNGTPYPYAFEGVEWGIAEPAEFTDLIDARHQLGLHRYSDEIVFFIRKKL